MSEAFTPLTAPEAVAAAHRIYERVNGALSIRRGLTGVPDREFVLIVILARQLDAIARAAAAVCPEPDHAAFTLTTPEIRCVDELRELLQAAGYLPLPETTAQEPTHGEG